MTKSIKYIRIMTGDELITEVVHDGVEVISLMNPMILEYVEMETGANHPFMTRFNPYSVDGAMRINKNQIVFMTDTTPEMITYYKSSLEYIENTCDQLVTDRTIKADEFIRAAEDNPSHEMPIPSDPESPGFNPNVFPMSPFIH